MDIIKIGEAYPLKDGIKQTILKDVSEYYYHTAYVVKSSGGWACVVHRPKLKDGYISWAYSTGGHFAGEEAS